MDVGRLKLDERKVVGKKVKQLRRQGIVPVHVYGSDMEPLPLQSDVLVLRRILPRVGTNIPLSVDIEGHRGEYICFVREVQRHPVTEDILHVDFLRVDVSQTIQSDVPVNLVGESPAVEDLSGVLFQSLQSVTVEALPMNIPASFEIDISVLDDFDKSIYVGDIALPSNVTMISDPEDLIARVSPPRLEVEEEEEEEEGEVETEFEQDEEGESSEESEEE